jgi:hypothetical protein
VSILMMHPLTATLLFATVLTPQVSTSLPWVFPGDFRDRLRMSDLVVSGRVEATSWEGVRTVDSTQVAAHIANVWIDRVFQGRAKTGRLRFEWSSLHMATSGGGFAYSGPPLADFRTGRRYLIFLKRTRIGWEVAMPVYAIEAELAAALPRGAARDVSKAPLQQRYQELAEELEDAALAQPPPPPGMTGEAASYFPWVFDLLGGCAETFYRRFLSAPSPELHAAASTWLELIRLHHLECKGASAQGPR